jgi:alkanesulfonate monooxygenase SsuD/methylene tetrahydromethanopterin reductase-like flavin-dependent oxidoreductase (luciferase family)
VSAGAVECAPNLTDASIDPVDWAQQREREGWAAISASDHLFDGSRAYAHWAVTLAQFAMATSHVRIGSSFANNLLRSPVEFAQAALSLQRASHGRFEAGLGAGWAEAEIRGIGLRYPSPGERAGRYAEAMQVVRTLFRDGRCSLRGEHYEIDVPEIAPKVDPPPLVGSVGGPRTIREITPLVDRVELKVSSAATRGGRLDFGLLAAVELDHLNDLVARVCDVRDDIPIGVFIMVGSGDHPRVAALRDALDGSFMGGFVGEPERVADAVRALGTHGIDRVQLTPYTPSTIELLAPHLSASARIGIG